MLGSGLESDFHYSPQSVGAASRPENSSKIKEFPSGYLSEKIRALPTVNTTPTQLMGMTSEQIALLAASLEDPMVIDVSKAPPEEHKSILAAVGKEVEIQGVIKKPVITILDTESDRDAEGFTTEDRILRNILGEMLGEADDADTIGKRAYREFIRTLVTVPANYRLVLDEWNSFIVGHSLTGNAVSPLESHHLHNVGLRYESEGEDPLRDSVIQFVTDTMAEFGNEVSKFFEGDRFKPHSALDSQQNTPMNEPRNRNLALGLAELSNLVRGAVYYRTRKGDKSLQEYPPRRLAAVIIDQVSMKF